MNDDKKRKTIWDKKEAIMNGTYRYKSYNPPRTLRQGTKSDNTCHEEQYDDATRYTVNWIGMRITHAGTLKRGEKRK